MARKKTTAAKKAANAAAPEAPSNKNKETSDQDPADVTAAPVTQESAGQDSDPIVEDKDLTPPDDPTSSDAGTGEIKEPVVELKRTAEPFVAKHLLNWFSEEEASEVTLGVIEAVEQNQIVAIVANEDGQGVFLQRLLESDYGDRAQVQSYSAENGQRILALFNQILFDRGFVVRK